MNRSRRNYINLKKLIINLFFLLLISKSIFSNEITFEIEGNQFTDYDVILSLLNEIPKNVDKEYSNDILKALNAVNPEVPINILFLRVSPSGILFTQLSCTITNSENPPLVSTPKGLAIINTLSFFLNFLDFEK